MRHRENGSRGQSYWSRPLWFYPLFLDRLLTNTLTKLDSDFKLGMIYQREQIYQRALKTLEQLARRKHWDFRPPVFDESEVRPTVIILRDHHNEIAWFRFTYRNRLALVDHAFHDH
jgi:hypothetical protein